jgi:2-dehydropantoate 2-reductase
MNLGNSIEALCGRAERGGELMRRARDGALAVLQTAGIAYVGRDEDRARRADIMTIGEIDGRPRTGGSSWQSLERGTGNIETDHLNGEIVLLGRLHDIPTPTNELLQRRASQAARDHTAPGTVSADELLAALPDVDRRAGARGR